MENMRTTRVELESPQRMSVSTKTASLTKTHLSQASKKRPPRKRLSALDINVLRLWIVRAQINSLLHILHQTTSCGSNCGSLHECHRQSYRCQKFVMSFFWLVHVISGPFKHFPAKTTNTFFCTRLWKKTKKNVADGDMTTKNPLLLWSSRCCCHKKAEVGENQLS